MGRTISKLGHHYIIREYHLTLCKDPVPNRVAKPYLLQVPPSLS